ncbi:Zinc finger protein 701 [Araneus ventricosus]|uniref:Zinc finger protein 701 n=1 Tax=Araneus ventricosus TaxID=182803 RepID=A0A4Y2SCN2_ARAVE|nr:Zinc finger protein 701 [Araneus ventricosus]
MIVYCCVICSTPNYSEVLRCSVCGGDQFLEQNFNLTLSESTVAQTTNTRHESTKLTGEVDGQVIDSRPSQHQQNVSAWKDIIFPYEDSSVIECRRSQDADTINIRNQNIPLGQEQPLQHFSQDPTVVNILSPEIHNNSDHRHSLHAIDNDTCNPSSINFLSDLNIPNPEITFAGQTNYIRQSSNPTAEVASQVIGSSHIQREQNESPWIDFNFPYEDSSVSEYRRSQDADTINFRGQDICWEQEQIFSHVPNVMNTLSPEMQNSWGPTLSFHRQDDESANSCINCLTSPLSATCANLQHLMHISHQSSSTERENQSSIEMMLQMQRTVESSEIENIGDQILFAGSSASASCMSQSVPENFIIDHNVRDTRNKASHSSADLSSTRGNSSTGNLFSEDLESVNEASQQDAHSSEKQTRLGGMENDPALSALPVKRSPSPTSKLVFECKKCTRKYTKDFLLNAHMQDHDKKNPYKCNKCPMEFQYESWLRRHYEVHTEEKPFKCNQCDFECKRKEHLKRHIGYRHKSQLSSQQIPSKKKFKCVQCSRKFIQEAAFNAHVLNNICDPNRFTCDQCSSKFRSESSLKYHYRFHMGEKPFKCDQCAYASSSKVNLKMHQYTKHKK